MINSVKQLTDSWYCISAWHRRGLAWPISPDEQKNLQRTTLNQRVLGSSPSGLTRPGRNGSESFRSLFCPLHAQRIEESLMPHFITLFPRELACRLTHSASSNGASHTSHSRHGVITAYTVSFFQGRLSSRLSGIAVAQADP
jgi:hypothetical protein